MIYDTCVLFFPRLRLHRVSKCLNSNFLHSLQTSPGADPSAHRPICTMEIGSSMISSLAQCSRHCHAQESPGNQSCLLPHPFKIISIGKVIDSTVMHHSVFPSCQDSGLQQFRTCTNVQAVFRKKDASTIMPYTDCAKCSPPAYISPLEKTCWPKPSLFPAFRIKQSQTFLGCVQDCTSVRTIHLKLVIQIPTGEMLVLLVLLPSCFLSLPICIGPAPALNSPSNCFSPVLPRMVTEPSNFPSYRVSWRSRGRVSWIASVSPSKFQAFWFHRTLLPQN